MYMQYMYIYMYMYMYVAAVCVDIYCLSTGRCGESFPKGSGHDSSQGVSSLSLYLYWWWLWESVLL